MRPGVREDIVTSTHLRQGQIPPHTWELTLGNGVILDSIDAVAEGVGT